jgi:hypothetical protein
LQNNNGNSLSSSNNSLTGKITPNLVENGSDIPPELILDGARALSGFCRPYPIRTVGQPTRLDFDIATSTFKLWVTVSADDKSDDTVKTEIYIPFAHYAAAIALIGEEASKSKLAKASVDNAMHDLKKLDISSKDEATSAQLELALEVVTSTGRWETHGQHLHWYYPTPKSGQAEYTIEIRRKGGVIPERLAKPMSWMDMIPQPTGCVIA